MKTKSSSPLDRWCVRCTHADFFHVLPVWPIRIDRLREWDARHHVGRRWVIETALGWGFWHVQLSVFI